MVRVVVAGGSGNVAREVIEVLQEKKHEVTVFSRKDVSDLKTQGLDAVQVDYTNKDELVKLLKGVDCVLSFIVVASDPDNIAQRTLIDACVEAGVKRFAPNEWSTRSKSGLSWYAAKDEIHEYLLQTNKPKKVLEFTLFQPGLFLNYLSYPHSSGTHFHNTALQFDLQNRRAIVLADPQGANTIAFTSVQDLAAVVAAAVDFQGEWPETGGMRGGRITVSELIELGEKIRGGPFAIERVAKADLEAGQLKTTWVPPFDHPNVSAADLVATGTGALGSGEMEDPTVVFSRLVTIGSLISIDNGVWDVSDEWNRLLPDHRFTGIEEFVREAWKHKS